MEVTLTPEQEAALDRITQATGADRSQVVRDALDQWLAREETLIRLRADVQAGIDDIDAGRYKEFATKESLMQLAEEVQRRGLERTSGRRR